MSLISPPNPAGVANRVYRWLVSQQAEDGEGAYEQEGHAPQHRWWQVMCLTGVDYFSTLGYQPGIAALAAGVLSPIATCILVLLTVFGALPIYRRVAAESPHGEGSIAMLEHLLHWWHAKVFVLVLLGFVATDFVITITLSAADATAHIVENPLMPEALADHRLLVTLLLISILGAIFLKGFREAIGIAIVLVSSYLVLNLIVVLEGLYQIATKPSLLDGWRTALFTSHGSPLAMIGISLLVFPKLALGLSGFETGVAVMPLVRGGTGDAAARLEGRIRNTRKLLTTAALIMSVFLISSSFVTTLLIPAHEFAPGGAANGRALAFMAHRDLGNLFGTIYDVSTILILWFAGASAMAGLLNIVPRYLPRYGMAPDWARANRPLTLVFIAVAFGVTAWFRASVDAQGGAYATGVLVLMSSAAVAVTLAARRDATGARRRWLTLAFGAITLVFVYTTIANIFERPEGLQIALCFITAIVVTSFISRAMRSTELRVEQLDVDAAAQRMIDEAASDGVIRVIAKQPGRCNQWGYRLKEQEARADNHIPPNEPVLFLEVTICDASEFVDVLRVRGVQVGDYRVLRAESPAVPNAIVALLLYMRDRTGKLPHVYFGWAEGNPAQFLLRFLLFGDGDVPPVTREVLRKAEPDRARRPVIHVGG